MAPQNGQVDHILPPSKVGLYDLPCLLFLKKVDHILPPFLAKSASFCRMGGVGKSYPSTIFLQAFFDVFCFFALGMVEGYDLPNFGQKPLFLQNGENR